MSRPFRAVVIDDQPLCREFLKDYLTERGYQVDCYSGQQFQSFCSQSGACCQAERPCADLLLTDNRMPHRSGLELLEEQIARGCKLVKQKRAVLSGGWSREERQRAIELGCQVFDKPFDLSGMDAWLEQDKKAS